MTRLDLGAMIWGALTAPLAPVPPCGICDRTGGLHESDCNADMLPYVQPILAAAGLDDEEITAWVRGNLVPNDAARWEEMAEDHAALIQRMDEDEAIANHFYDRARGKLARGKLR